ncbi:MAG: SpoIIE family protein phosphatase [Lachnospirales bacterium]
MNIVIGISSFLGILTYFYDNSKGQDYIPIIIGYSLLIKYITTLSLFYIWSSYIKNYKKKLYKNLSELTCTLAIFPLCLSIISLLGSLVVLVNYKFQVYHVLLALVECSLVYFLSFYISNALCFFTLSKPIQIKKLKENEMISLMIFLFIIIFSIKDLSVLNIQISMAIFVLSMLVIATYFDIYKAFLLSSLSTFFYVAPISFTFNELGLNVFTMGFATCLMASFPYKNKYALSFIFLFLYLFIHKILLYNYNNIFTYSTIVFAIICYLLIDFDYLSKKAFKYPSLALKENKNNISLVKLKRKINFTISNQKTNINNINKIIEREIENIELDNSLEKINTFKKLILTQSNLYNNNIEALKTTLEQDFSKYIELESKLLYLYSKNNFNVKSTFIQNFNNKLEVTIILGNYVDTYRNNKNICNLTSSLIKGEVKNSDDFYITKSYYYSKDNSYILILREKQKLQYDIEISTHSKKQEEISGDSFTKISLPKGIDVIALADGMGSGYDAFLKSSTALNILDDLLLSDISIDDSISLINNLSLLTNNNDTFTTLDLLLIDKNNCTATFIKLGACPSYLQRNGLLRKIEDKTLPLGILEEITYKKTTINLNKNDKIVFYSDGIYEANKDVYNGDAWLQSLIKNSNNKSLKSLCNSIVSKALSFSNNVPCDDMLLICVNIKDVN